MTTIGIWTEPRDNASTFAFLRSHGYPAWYQRDIVSALEAARSLGFDDVDAIGERFPGSVPNANPGDGASLRDFADWRSGVNGWTEMIRSAQMTNAHTGERRKYIAYLRPPADLGDDAAAWGRVRDRLAGAGCSCMTELNVDRSDSEAKYAQLSPLAIEPWATRALNWTSKYRPIVAAKHLADLGTWPPAWPMLDTTPGIGKYLIMPDSPLDPVMVRALGALGWTPMIYAHRLTEAAT